MGRVMWGRGGKDLPPTNERGEMGLVMNGRIREGSNLGGGGWLCIRGVVGFLVARLQLQRPFGGCKEFLLPNKINDLISFCFLT